MVIAIYMFWGLDSYYLRQERLFISLYDHVRLNKIEKEEYFSMKVDKFKKKVDSWIRTMFSKTELGFYGTLILIIILGYIGLTCIF